MLIENYNKCDMIVGMNVGGVRFHNKFTDHFARKMNNASDKKKTEGRKKFRRPTIIIHTYSETAGSTPIRLIESNNRMHR